MRPHWWNAGVAAALAVSGYGVSGGCSTPSNPFRFSKPPAVAAGSDYARPHESDRTVIAVAPFANPDKPRLDWPDLGLKVSEAMRRTLLNEGDFVVRTGPDIDKLVSARGFGSKGGAKGVAPVDVDFILTGKVTDFHHTAWLPKDASRWSFFWRRTEAVVAIDWKVIDVRTRRVVAADHTYGNHDASGKTKPEESYYGLDISTYLFWNTPLGKASRKAIDKSIKRMRAMLPARLGDPTVVQVRSGGRKITVEGGWSWGLA